MQTMVKTAPAVAISTDEARRQIVFARAMQLVGGRYAWGGSSPRTGFDCSGLVNYVLGAIDVAPGRTSESQANAGVRVERADLQIGDIVVFQSTYARGYSHTGIYVGSGNFVHAADYGAGVEVSSLSTGYWSRHFAEGRRVI